ncbi:hypothetical protein DUI87_23894 [Hirundo rustica rustica]|uniref:Uncharacterized protein n=1 Tax=Hirundo rustica rustica TaxID=333673 RepID=A0A3M0JF68_HIRRU|nr:hypothetical protein DUI87_23894 [Hirundo rustica rustica]
MASHPSGYLLEQMEFCPHKTHGPYSRLSHVPQDCQFHQLIITPWKLDVPASSAALVTNRPRVPSALEGAIPQGSVRHIHLLLLVEGVVTWAMDLSDLGNASGVDGSSSRPPINLPLTSRASRLSCRRTWEGKIGWGHGFDSLWKQHCEYRDILGSASPEPGQQTPADPRDIPNRAVPNSREECPSPAARTIPDPGQDAIGLLGHLGTLLALVLLLSPAPQVPLCLGTVQPLCPQPVALQGVVVAKVQDLALGLVKLHVVRLGLSIQPVQVPLKSPPILQQIDTCSQLRVICKSTDGGLNPLTRIISEDIKQNWPQHRPLKDTTGAWLPAARSTVPYHSLVQPAPNPAQSAPVQGMGCQLFQKGAVGNSVKGLAEVQIDNIHSLPCIHQVGHLFIKGDQVGQAVPTPPKSMLAGPDPLAML